MTLFEYVLAISEQAFHPISMARLEDMSDKDIEALAEKEALVCSSCHLEESQRFILFNWCGKANIKGLCEDCEMELAREIDEIVQGRVSLQ